MAAKTKKVTPLMKQYNAIKNKYPDAMLLFRVGDFYETFGQDAIKAAKILDIVLTKRGAGSETETELAGFPHHAINTYLPKLVKAGMRVAICDQLEDPKLTKTIVKRGVTELVTPGVSMNDEVLSSKSNNFLAAVHFGKKNLGIAFIDISTGEFLTAQGNREHIDKLLQNFSPNEVLVQHQFKSTFNSYFGSDFYTFYVEDWVFKQDYANENLTDQFKTNSLKGFGIDDLKEGIIAAGAIIHYLHATQHKKLNHISTIKRIYEDRYVWMDKFTVKNLEIYQPSTANGITLLSIIDQTLTPMGSRLLKRWLALPLIDIEAIKNRQEFVKFLINNESFFDLLTEQLTLLSDLERLASKIATQKISPREVNHLNDSLKAIIPIKVAAEKSKHKKIHQLGKQLISNEKIIAIIDQTLAKEAPVALNKGHVITQGFSAELDELRNMASSGKSYLDQLLQRESDATGIPSLKIAFNNVFGYYIEVRNTHKNKVPESWIRKQTLVSSERYITEELKSYETKILGAEEKIAQLEQQLYYQLISELSKHIGNIQQNAKIMAKLDCLASFVTVALKNNYVCPEINNNTDLTIKNGRHPVIEKQLPIGETYIANDLILNQSQQQIIMITGPNMSGKSAILRQTALIILLAQIGSYVPVQHAEIGVVDKIFTRVGASDNISMGESTFMVEMNETASILNNITPKSLVLLDEIGRGTSTYDGISIAWAIAEYLHEHPAKPKTLFATHYHELNDMANSFNRIKNFNVSVKEMNHKVLFLRKLVPGGSEHSFGIYVAKLAGMPSTVVHKASKMLKQLEKNHTQEDLKKSLKKATEEDLQLSIFKLDDPLLEELKDEILSTNIDTLTPIEALMKLNEIKRMLTKK
ncbi:MAG: DNA mismatch repair protein MutS [Lutibacter sp.]